MQFRTFAILYIFLFFSPFRAPNFKLIFSPLLHMYEAKAEAKAKKSYERTVWK